MLPESDLKNIILFARNLSYKIIMYVIFKIQMTVIEIVFCFK